MTEPGPDIRSRETAVSTGAYPDGATLPDDDGVARPRDADDGLRKVREHVALAKVARHENADGVGRRGGGAQVAQHPHRQVFVLADQLEPCLVVDVPGLARARFEQRLQRLAERVAFTAEPAGATGRMNRGSAVGW